MLERVLSESSKELITSGSQFFSRLGITAKVIPSTESFIRLVNDRLLIGLTIDSSISAHSNADLAMGPAWSKVFERGIIPFVLTNP